MSFAGYAVAIELALKNNVSRGLAALTSEFTAFNRGIAGAQGNLDAFHRKLKDIKMMGAMGAGIAAGGVAMLSLLKGPYENAKAFAQAKTDFENLNLSATDNATAFAQAAANSHKVLGTNITENIRQINDLHTAFGDLHHALRSSEAYAQFAFAAKIANGGIEVPGLTAGSVKALEQRGGKVINDDATFLDELRMQSKVYFGSRGKVSGKDFFAASQTGGMAYTLLDKEYLYGPFAALMQAKSGATAGTAQMTEFSALIGGHMDNKAKGFLADLGMLQVGVSKAQVALVNQAVGALAMPEKEKQKLMKAMMPITGGLKDSLLGVAAHRPDLLVNDYLVPAIRQKFGMNMTDEEIGQLVTEKFNRGTSKLLGELIVNNLKFSKDSKIFSGAKDFTSAYQAYLKSPEGAEVAAAESWKNLSTMIGVTFIPKITEGLGSLAEGLDSLSLWTQKHPNLTKDLTGGFIALGSAMAIGGTLTLVTSGFKGLALALELGSLGGIGGLARIASGLTGVGTGLGAISGVAGLATLGATLGTVASGLGLLAATTASMGWLLTNVVDPDTDPLKHPGMRRKHMHGQPDIWVPDETLPQDHKGMHFQRYGRGGTWVKDIAAMPQLPTSVDHEGMILGRKGQGWIKDPNYVKPYVDAIAGVTEMRKIQNNAKKFATLPPMAIPDNAKKFAATAPRAPTPPQAKAPSEQEEKRKEQENLDAAIKAITDALFKGFNLTVQNYIDGRDVASHLIPNTSRGTSGINPSASRMTGAMSSYGLGG